MNIRQATLNDIPAIATLHVTGWQGAYGGLVDQDYLGNLTIEKRMADWTGWIKAGETQSFLAEIDSQPAGFITVGRTKTPPPGSSPIRPSHSGEIYALYLHPDCWRQGIGTALFHHGIERLKEQGHTSVCLWVLDGNKRGKAFYNKMGGQKLGGKMIEIGPSKLKEICYGWRDTSILLP